MLAWRKSQASPVLATPDPFKPLSKASTPGGTEESLSPR